MTTKNSKVPYIVFGQPVFDKAETAAVVNTLKSRWIGTGPQTMQFEKSFAHYVNAPYASAVNSCTAALHLTLEALDLPEGAEVITSAMTFCATANAIIHAGCVPVLCDVDPVSKNITPENILKKITKKTRAILPVHFAGFPCDMKAICALAKKKKLFVIEDCAHAVETTIDGRHAGTWGDFGCFSFYVTKNITTAEGGMVVTSHKALDERIRILALHGMDKDAWKRFSDKGFKHYEVIFAGYKYNMTDLQACLGLVQLAKIEKFKKQRIKLWNVYQKQLQGLACTLPQLSTKTEGEHARHLFCIEVDPKLMGGKTRDQVINELHALGIGTGVHYQALNLHPYYQKVYGYKRGDFPVAENYGARTISLPFSPGLTTAQVERIVHACRKVLKIM